MPSLQTARRVANAKNNGAKTIGQIYKEQSDWAMEQTFENDIATKTCYIYDHFHDDFFTDEHGITRSLAEGMTYENTNKTKIDAKFIIKSYQSMDKDQVEYYIMFRPSQPVSKYLYSLGFDKQSEYIKGKETWLFKKTDDLQKSLDFFFSMRKKLRN